MANIKQPCHFTRSPARCKTGAIWYKGFWNEVLTLHTYSLLKSHGLNDFKLNLNQINLINFMSFFIWSLHIQDLKRNSLTIFDTFFSTFCSYNLVSNHLLKNVSFLGGIIVNKMLLLMNPTWHIVLTFYTSWSYQQLVDSLAPSVYLHTRCLQMSKISFF